MKDNPVLQAIHNRRSIRRYKDTPLTKDQINSLLGAALMSPSSMNMQPWHITVLTNPQTILDWEKDIVQHFIDANNEFAIEHNKSHNNKVFYDAPAVFVISMEEEKAMDVGIMAQSITLAAKGLGLDSIILGFPRVSFEPKHNDKWNKALKFPKNYIYGISVAVGYAKESGKERKPDMAKVSYID